MTRGEIFSIILIEAGLLGVIGTALGLGLGYLLGRGAVQMVTTSINDLFFVVTVRRIDFPPLTMLKGAISGIAAALVAAVLPAYEATNVKPASALQRSNIEERVRTALNWVSVIGIGILLSGIALLIPEWHLSITFVGIFAIIIGISLFTPTLTLGLMYTLSGLARVLGKSFSPLIRLAIRDITRSLSRTSVAIAALMVTVSVIVGVGLMISSFRLTVERWLTDLLQADIFVSAPSLISDQTTFPACSRCGGEVGDISRCCPDRNEPVSKCQCRRLRGYSTCRYQHGHRRRKALLQGSGRGTYQDLGSIGEGWSYHQRTNVK